jgi:uncharacterized repeat protein (TIGR02543 family)
MKRRVLSLLLAAVMLLSSAATAISASTDLSGASSARTIALATGVSVTETIEDDVYNATIDSLSMANIQKLIELDEVAAVDLCKNALLAIGLSETTVNRMEQSEILEMFADVVQITATTKYVMVDADGAEVILSKEAAYEQAAIVEAQRMDYLLGLGLDARVAGSPSRGEGYTYDTTSGVMAITTMSAQYPLVSGIGKYVLWGEFKWLSTPSSRKLDGVSLGVAGSAFVWAAKTSGEYCSDLSYIKTNLYNGPATYSSRKTTTDMDVNSSGVYYTWSLPEDVAGICSNIVITIRGVGWLANPYEVAGFNLYTKYVHETSTFFIGNPTIGWSIFPPGVSISAGLFSGYSNVAYTSSNVNTYYPWVFVNNSYASVTGQGQYSPNTTVTINAGTRPGYTFSHWTIDYGGITLANPNSATTTFNMPPVGVSVTANWR